MVHASSQPTNCAANGQGGERTPIPAIAALLNHSAKIIEALVNELKGSDLNGFLVR